MKKFWLLVPLIILVVFYARERCPFEAKQSQPIIKVGEKMVQVEIMRTEAEREKGLSGRRSLCQDCGLVFLFDSPNYYTFWMKEMYFDIDIIWIAGDKVVDITDNAKAPPPGEFESPKQTYTSQVPADKVLEVNAGWAKKKGIRVGDEVSAD